MEKESIERKVLRAFLKMSLEDLENRFVRGIVHYVARNEKVPVLEVANLLADLITTADPPAQDAPEKQNPSA